MTTAPENEKSRPGGMGSGETGKGSKTCADVRQAAIDLATAGTAIFPCKPSKAPYTPHGFKTASSDPAIVSAWWTRWPDAMIGLPTGGGLVVIDTDQKNGKDGEGELCKLEDQHGALPATLTVETVNHGLHRYFTVPEGTAVRSSADKLAQGVDVRGAGGYVIAPPSPGYSIAVDMPRAELPAPWLELLTRRGNLEDLPPPKHEPTDTENASSFPLFLYLIAAQRIALFLAFNSSHTLLNNILSI